MQFRILNTGDEVNLINYVREYISNNEDTQIMIGCDSLNRYDETIYGLVVVLYKPKKGGHVLYQRIKVPRIRDRWSRLWKEVEYSINTANFIVDNEIQKPEYIDIDLNPDPRFKSNDVLRAALGFVEGLGYKARVKPYSLAASYAADKVCH